MEVSATRLTYIVFQPTRWKILECLEKSSELLYVRDIATITGEDIDNVADHLTVLEHYGFVESEYRKIEKPTNKKPGRIGKFYRIKREKIDEALKKIREELSIPHPRE